MTYKGYQQLIHDTIDSIPGNLITGSLQKEMNALIIDAANLFPSYMYDRVDEEQDEKKFMYNLVKIYNRLLINFRFVVFVCKYRYRGTRCIINKLKMFETDKTTLYELIDDETLNRMISERFGDEFKDIEQLMEQYYVYNPSTIPDMKTTPPEEYLRWLPVNINVCHTCKTHAPVIQLYNQYPDKDVFKTVIKRVFIDDLAYRLSKFDPSLVYKESLNQYDDDSEAQSCKDQITKGQFQHFIPYWLLKFKKEHKLKNISIFYSGSCMDDDISFVSMVEKLKKIIPNIYILSSDCDMLLQCFNVNVVYKNQDFRYCWEKSREILKACGIPDSIIDDPDQLKALGAIFSNDITHFFLKPPFKLTNNVAEDLKNYAIKYGLPENSLPLDIAYHIYHLNTSSDLLKYALLLATSTFEISHIEVNMDNIPHSSYEELLGY